MTNFNTHSIQDFNAALASENPTPGGGTACAVALSNAMSLTAMVCSITLGREKWESGWPAAEKGLECSNFDSIQWAMSAATKDALVFDAVMDAYRLPKVDEEKILERKIAIQEATRGAAEVPLQVAKKALSVMETLPGLASSGNGNAVTDIAVAALLADSACKGAIFNVRINISSLSTDDVTLFQSELRGLSERSTTLLTEILHNVELRL